MEATPKPNDKVTGTRIRARVSRSKVPDMKRLFDEFCPHPKHVGFIPDSPKS